jgi:hypothetical protein
MISRILVISAFTAGLAALPALASAQTSTTTPMTNSGTMGTHTQPTNMDHMGSGSMDMGSSGFDARHYRTAADCLNAATVAHVSLSACSSLHNR